MKSPKTQAEQKLMDLGYSRDVIRHLMGSGHGYYGLASGLSVEEIIATPADKLARLCEQILNADYD